jgi:hypothetical protein
MFIGEIIKTLKGFGLVAEEEPAPKPVTASIGPRWF